MASDSSQMNEDDDKSRNWEELPPELTSSILSRLGVVDILENAQKVCTEWRRVSKYPSMWRKIDMQNIVSRPISNDDLRSMCRNAVDRSEGGLVEIKLGNFCSGDLLSYITDRSSNLRSVGLEMVYPITNEEFVKAVAKLPLLEELEVLRGWTKLNLKAVGHSCPKLKMLKLNCSGYISPWTTFNDDHHTLPIAESMPQLRHLQLLGNRLTDNGLKAILDSCPHLEHLDLRQCLNINLSGDLEKRCSERVKFLDAPMTQPLIVHLMSLSSVRQIQTMITFTIMTIILITLPGIFIFLNSCFAGLVKISCDWI